MEYSYSKLKIEIRQLIAARKSFVAVGLNGQLVEASALIERSIEEAGLSCRVYTRNRVYAAGAMSWTGAGLFSLAAIAAHNIVTFNPDYEVGRAVVDNKIYVDFKK